MEVRRDDGSVIAVEVAGEQGGAPVLLCHGLADSRLSARLFTQAARELGLRIMAPDRPGTGRTDPRRLGRLADWAEDAALVLDGLRAESAALLGISAGGPFAAACAARLPGRPQPHAGLPARPAGVAYPRDGARGTAVFGGGQARSGVRRLVSRPPGRAGAPLTTAVPPPCRQRATRHRPPRDR